MLPYLQNKKGKNEYNIFLSVFFINGFLDIFFLLYFQPFSAHKPSYLRINKKTKTSPLMNTSKVFVKIFHRH